MDYYINLIEQFSTMDMAYQISMIIFTVAAILLLVIAEWNIFTKAGVKGWYSLIPFLREYKLVEIADGNGIKFLLFLIPVVNIFYSFILNFRMAAAFGKGAGFGFGLIFFPNIFMLILGFGRADYIGPRGEHQQYPYY